MYQRLWKANRNLSRLSGWNSREGAPIGRNRYVELEIKKTKPNGASTKLPPDQKPCDKMTDAIVTDGGKRGQLVKVCADPTCRVHHPNTVISRYCPKDGSVVDFAAGYGGRLLGSLAANRR